MKQPRTAQPGGTRRDLRAQHSVRNSISPQLHASFACSFALPPSPTPFKGITLCHFIVEKVLQGWVETNVAVRNLLPICVFRCSLIAF